jgi:CheY-like chemotaxis protein
MIELILDKKINLNYRYSAIHKMIMGDESQLESLIINLIINARDAIEDIPEEPSIEIGTEDTEVLMDMHLSHGEVIKPGKYIKLYVKDNGSGMSKDTLGRIFEPYFTTKNKSKGTGLGLSVVFGTVRSHSGFINVESQESLGTCFEIFFPVLENNIESPAEKIKKVLESNLIMLVDDDLNVLDIEAELLEDLGYDVMKFFNPIDALQYYMNEYEKLGFVVLDMMMPQMSGKMLYKELQKINKDVTAIFISGYTGQTDYEELIRNGSIVIEKPFTVGDLSSQIAKIYM